MFFEEIRSYAVCCACGGSLEASKHINMVMLDKEAGWKVPVWNNILVRDQHPENRALAILCDSCIRVNNVPKFALEIVEDSREVKYHPLGQLQDLPEISEEEVWKAELEGLK